MSEKDQQLVEELVRITIERGITSEDLREHVHEAYTGVWKRSGLPWEVLDSLLEDAAKQAEKISAAGRAAQLHALVDRLGSKGARALVMSMGSMLDGFVRRYSSDPAEVEEDIGWDNINGNGGVLSDD